MFTFVKLLSAAAALSFLASCSSTYRAECAPGALAGYRSASVTVVPDYSGDAVIKRSLQDELRRRGLTATDPNLGEKHEGKKLEVKFADTWYWDIVMYLMQCDVSFLDADTKELKASVTYRNSVFHQYPSRVKMARRVFETLDKKKAFTKQ